MFKITGFDQFEKQLTDLQQRAERLEGTHTVSMEQLLTPEFLRSVSSFSSFTEMCEASGFKVESQEDFAAIPDADWDAFVARTTRFAKWEDMLQEAGVEYTKRQLGF
jgi:hypothetical protein